MIPNSSKQYFVLSTHTYVKITVNAMIIIYYIFEIGIILIGSRRKILKAEGQELHYTRECLCTASLLFGVRTVITRTDGDQWYLILPL
jgi:hypothetical protein